jgi:hypothetical protein
MDAERLTEDYPAYHADALRTAVRTTSRHASTAGRALCVPAASPTADHFGFVRGNFELWMRRRAPAPAAPFRRAVRMVGRQIAAISGLAMLRRGTPPATAESGGYTLIFRSGHATRSTSVVD